MPALAIGNDGITIPALQASAGTPATNTDVAMVKVQLDVPALDAGVHTVATSLDGGTTWRTAIGAIAFTGLEQANPTAAAHTGTWQAWYGPYLPGTMFRLTSSVAQTAVPTVRFGL